MSRDRAITLASARKCSDCRVRGLCLPGGMTGHDIERLEQLITYRAPLHRGESLLEPGDHFNAVYAVRSGSLKGIAVSSIGRKQVNGFHFPGEFLGFDAIANSLHRSGAVALETTSVCVLPFDRLSDLARESRNVQDRLINLMSRELGTRDIANRSLATANAQKKVAGFLLNLGARHALCGYSHTDFHLSMSRQDIASYLGVAKETMSRVLTSFQEAGLVAIHGTGVSILRPERLSFLSGWSQDSHMASTNQRQSG